jgi:NCS2 family nucleobase:cation symporter-2
VIGGLFNTFPYTSFSQNVGLVGVTGIRSRFVCVAAGVILIAFGLFPKMAHAASIPQFVLGGAGIVMFGWPRPASRSCPRSISMATATIFSSWPSALA